MVENRIEFQEKLERHKLIMREIRQIRPLLLEISRYEIRSLTMTIPFAPGVRNADEKSWLLREVRECLCNLQTGPRAVDVVVYETNRCFLQILIGVEE